MNCNHVTSSSTYADSNNTNNKNKGNNNNNGGTNNINNSSYTNKHSNKIQMTEPWSIPRPTLSSSASSSNSSQKSNSTPASLNRKQPKHRAATHHGSRGHRNLAYQHDGTYSSNSSNEYDTSYYLQRQQRSHSKSLDELKQRFDDFNTTTKPTNGGVNYSSYKLNGQQQQQQVTNIDEHDEPTPKRGSRSSQGSSDSNNSSHSASSGSLLLTVANLENFAKIHQKTCSTGSAKQPYSIYNTNITLPSHPEDRVADQHAARDDAHTIVSMAHPKTKDLDALSMASSTHFTVVNGMTGPQRVPKSGLCSRGHQITVLIVTMSMIFLIGISAAVFMLEMRARDMPQ